MKLDLRIALRYLLWRGSFNFISIITYISLIGIIIGVASLIIVMAIFNGFAKFTEQQLIALDPHIKITAKSGAWVDNSDSILNIIRKIDGVVIASPNISGRAIAINRTNMNALLINGFKPSEINEISGIPNSMIRGTFNIGYHLGYPALVIGSGLQKRLDVNINDTIEILTPSMLESSIKSFKRRNGKVFVITGIFQTNSKDYDEILAFTSLNFVQELFKTPENHFTSIDIRLNKIDNVEKVIEQILASISNRYAVYSWFDLHKDLYRIMQLERISAFIILSLIIIIALFNLLASLSMIVVTKQSDIALLKAIGFNNKKIKSLFSKLGLIIGSFGTITGVFLALFIYTAYKNPAILSQKIYSSDPFVNAIYYLFMQLLEKIMSIFSLDTEKYLLDRIPMSLNFIDIILVTIITILISYLATIYPSKRASNTNISQSLRNE